MTDRQYIQCRKRKNEAKIPVESCIKKKCESLIIKNGRITCKILEREKK